MCSMEELRQQCQNCQLCGLGATRKNLVFGDGNPDADVMFIGEGPGKQEDEQGIPFVGAAGQFLSRILEIIDLDRSRYYIANIVKCRPPKNRDPQAEEQDACIPYLNDQIQLVQPKIIVCLGRIAAMRIIDKDFRITRQHGQWFHRAGVAMTAIYHPSAVLRDPLKGPDTFVDLKSIQAKVKELCPDSLTPLVR